MTEQGPHGIGWCHFTSNPLRYRTPEGQVVWACEKLSPGCAHCYAAELALRYGRGGNFNAGVTRRLTSFLDVKEVLSFLTSRKIVGKRVFVGDMTDHHGEWVQQSMRDVLLAMYWMRGDVTVMTLTKRAERQQSELIEMTEDRLRAAVTGLSWLTGMKFPERRYVWPLPNLWPGVSVEDQERAGRCVSLARTPAARTFISYEPALGPVAFREIHSQEHGITLDAMTGLATSVQGRLRYPRMKPVDLIIPGAESGNDARAFMVDWMLRVIDDANVTGVNVFAKQLGPHPGSQMTQRWPSGSVTRDGQQVKLRDRKGIEMDEWPVALRVRQMPLPMSEQVVH